jgi:hypothetical protein
MLDDVNRAKIVITNFHAFKFRERVELSKGGRFAERDAIKFVQYGCSTEHYVSMTLDDTG